MAELVPYPFGRLISRMFRELERHRSIFDLPAKKFVLGPPAGKDVSVNFHDRRASTPLGPAAGPQSQLAQNLVLSWLGGGRIMELKTVQINDELVIPRPCIDMQTVGYNVEWSQELKLEQSLEEYVKGSMLIRILRESGVLPIADGFGDTIFDMSVGYDLKGIQTDRVQDFLDGMKDATAVIDRLRPQIPDEWARFRDLDFDPKISDTLTLSTFHGCPPDEIERMLEWLISEKSLGVIVKLNPTLLGRDEARRVFHDVLGYRDEIPDGAFDKDTKWDQAVGFCERLAKVATANGVRFGAKFTNTLIVRNQREFFPKTEKEMYLSGPPLHVLAMTLVSRFRETFGDTLPVSFSAGIERSNFPDAVACGLVPVTTCSDLLRPGGYGRMSFYFLDLAKRMDEVGARDLEEFTILAYGHGEEALLAGAEAFGTAGTATLKRCLIALHERNVAAGRAKMTDRIAKAYAEPPPDCCAEHRAGADLRKAAGALWKEWLGAARRLNSKSYVVRLHADESYKEPANRKLPPKVGTKLSLFDCITCDKCVPVCPNDANFTYTLPAMKVVATTMARDGVAWKKTAERPLALERKHQLANFADFCNECGNCDVFCPEDGGPYVMKPRFFGSHEQWRRWRKRDGFFLERENGTTRVWGRFDGRELRMERAGERVWLVGEGFSVRFTAAAPEATIEGEAATPVDLGWFHVMEWLRRGLFDSGEINYVSA